MKEKCEEDALTLAVFFDNVWKEAHAGTLISKPEVWRQFMVQALFSVGFAVYQVL